MTWEEYEPSRFQAVITVPVLDNSEETKKSLHDENRRPSCPGNIRGYGVTGRMRLRYLEVKHPNLVALVKYLPKELILTK